MKKIFLAFAAAAFMFAGCTKLEERVDALEKGQAELQKQIDELKESITGIQTIVDALNNKVYVSEVKETEDGYVIYFNNNTTAVLKDGETPVVGVMDIDGVLYWSVNGQPLRDADGNKVPAVGAKGEDGADGADGEDGKDGADGANGADGADGADGKDGADGADGKDAPVPSFEINAEGHLIVTIDGVSTDLGKVTGEKGADGNDGTSGDSWFTDVTVNDDCVVIVLKEGGEITLPLYNAFDIEFETRSYGDLFEGDVVNIKYTVTGSDDVTIRATAQGDCDVVVDVEAKNIKVTFGTGTKAEVDVWAWDNTTGEVRAKTLSFAAGTIRIEDLKDMTVSPLENTVEVPLATYVDYEVVIEESAKTWLYHKETKAMQNETVCITATKNETGAVRSGLVSFVYNDATVYSFTITQKAYDASILEIDWVETFGLYTSETAEEAESSYADKHFTIELSDDPSKGVYLVKGLLFCEGSFYFNNVSYKDQGGNYYADLENGVLTVYFDNATDYSGYYGYNPSEWTLTYDADAKTLTTATNVALTNWGGDDLIVKNWSAKEYEEPEVSGDSPFAGTWDQSLSVSFGIAATTMTITDNGDGTVTLTDFIYEGTSMTGTVTGDNQITIAGGTSVTSSTGPLSADVVLTLADGKLTTADFVIGGWVNVTSYTATKQEAAASLAELIAGSYSQTVNGMSWPSPSATMSIAANEDGSVTITDFVTSGTVVTVTLDGNNMTIAGGTSISGAGSLDSDVTLTVSDDKTTITGPAFSISGWINVSSYSATKQ